MELPNAEIQEICPTTRDICSFRSYLVHERQARRARIATLKKSPKRIYKRSEDKSSKELQGNNLTAIQNINMMLEAKTSCHDDFCTVGRLILRRATMGDETYS